MNVRYFRFITLVLMVLSLGWTLNTVLAAEISSGPDITASSMTDPTAQPTYRQAGPVVHAVMFWSQSCPYCHVVIDNVLPPLKEQYGEQFQILLVEVRTAED